MSLVWLIDCVLPVAGQELKKRYCLSRHRRALSLRRRGREPFGLVADCDGNLRQGGRVLPVMMRAEQQFQAAGQQDPDVSPGAAALAAVRGGKRPGERPVRLMAL